MDMKIRYFFGLIGFGLLTALLVLIGQTIQLQQTTNTLASLEHQRFAMLSKADELRQSSDDLTRMARSYVVTGDQHFRDDYFQILQIRNGEAPRPRNYNNIIYWDLPALLREQRHPPEAPLALQASLQALPFTPDERARLAEAERQSNDLVALEIEAFNAMEGLFQDHNGAYTRRAEVDQAHAIALLHSPEYHQAKARIMLPIDAFMETLNQRTEQQIQVVRDRQRQYFMRMLAMVGFTTMLICLIFYATQRKILGPVENLMHIMTTHRQQHDIGLLKTIFNQDEIGLMAEQFFIMKQQMDDDYEAMERLALSDHLTGARNRRYFFESGEQLLALHQRNQEPLCLALLDIDFFKKINDTHGHPVGDEVLRQLATICQQSIRKSDLFARLGGEEFAILYPQMNIQHCMPMLERLRGLIEAHGYQHDEYQVNYTVSIGITENRPEDSLSILLSRADQALYRAKAGGRNQVRVAMDDGLCDC